MFQVFGGTELGPGEADNSFRKKMTFELGLQGEQKFRARWKGGDRGADMRKSPVMLVQDEVHTDGLKRWQT